ncbi:hypothetical protein HPB50_025988 [Hyalomma asiaticum]|uniref:Uncharacterized protein n=1 Tax=Hyalomma asiaticum TaxID=266040 RepID=A0ACB7STS2_HYAAI|nr:hypothetical protein HPB50_025988 [Hyalomma asiaticum]
MSHTQHNTLFEEGSPSRETPHQQLVSKKAASLVNAPCGAHYAAPADAAAIRGRHRSLAGVKGERRNLVAAETDVTKPPECYPDDAKLCTGDSGLHRQRATTSLLRLAQRSPARTCLAFTSGLIFLVVVLAALSLARFTRKASRGSEDRGRHMEVRDSSSIQVAACAKDACRQMGLLLKDSLDVSRDPCEDFHAYVCGSWPTKHPGRSVTQVLASTFMSNVIRRAKAVRIPYVVKTRKQTAVQKAARHLIACDDIVAEDDDQSAYVREVLAEAGVEWPDGGADGNASSDVLDNIIYMSQVVKIPVLIEVTLESSPVQRVVVKRPKNAASLLEASSRRIKNMTSQKYGEYFRAVYDALSQRRTPSDFRGRASRMSRLESVLVFSINPSLSTRRSRTLVPFTSRRIIETAASADSQEAILETHRARCFASSDRIFHYALEYPYLSDIVTAGVRDDVGKLMRRIGHSFVSVLARVGSGILSHKCATEALEKSASVYTAIFRRTRPEYFENIYEGFPDMTFSAITNWISTESHAPAHNASYEYDSFGYATGERHDSAWRTGLEASYMSAPWYGLDAPSAIKVAGIGSRAVGRLFSELILRKRACEKVVLAELEGTWRCMVDTLKDHSLEGIATKRAVLTTMLTRSILWEAFRGRTVFRMNETVLEDYPELTESALFFVFGCLWSCGEDSVVAKLRCNLPLKHDANFAKTFSCAPGSPMRPEVQCPHAFSAISLD